MFGLVKKVIVVAMTFFSCISLECVSMNNQECKIRPHGVNINSYSPFFYPYIIKVNKWSGSCLMTHILNCVFLMFLKT